MRILVINLDRSGERRESMCAQLGSRGLAHERLSAVDGSDGYAHFERYDAREFRLNTGRLAAAGEAGCYASHLSAWRRAIELGSPVLVLEDDAKLMPNFGSAVKAAARTIGDYGFIRLQSPGPGKRHGTVPVQWVGEFDLAYCERYPYGATAYAIAPFVARRFVEMSRVLTGPVDLFIKNFWVHGQPLFALSPHAVEGGPLRHQSTIPRRRPAQLTAGTRIHRGLRKLRWSADRALFNRRVLAGYRASPEGGERLATK